MDPLTQRGMSAALTQQSKIISHISGRPVVDIIIRSSGTAEYDTDIVEQGIGHCCFGMSMELACSLYYLG